MKVIHRTVIDLSPAEVDDVVRQYLEQATKGYFLKDGELWQDDPDWRHGSVSSEKVERPSPLLLAQITLETELCIASEKRGRK